MSKIVLLDCDGPLVNDTVFAFFQFVRRAKALNWSYEDYCRTGSWIKSTSANEGQIGQLYAEFVQSSYFSGYRPTAGSKMILHEIPVQARVLATSRTNILQPMTRAFMARHFGHFRAMHFQLQDKAAALIETYAIACFIEDNIREVKQALGLGVKTFLFPTRNFRHDNGVPKEVLLDAESMVHDDMSNEEWNQTCTVAWEQLEDLLAAAIYL